MFQTSYLSLPPGFIPASQQLQHPTRRSIAVPCCPQRALTRCLAKYSTRRSVAVCPHIVQSDRFSYLLNRYSIYSTAVCPRMFTVDRLFISYPCSSCSAACGRWFACPSTVVLACWIICHRVSSAVSVAKSVSRIRERAADAVSEILLRLRMVD